MDKHFVRSLNPSLAYCLPHGAIIKIANMFQMQPLAVSKIIKGEWTNEEIIRTAVAMVQEHRVQLDAFALQLPPETED